MTPNAKTLYLLCESAKSSINRKQSLVDGTFNGNDYTNKNQESIFDKLESDIEDAAQEIKKHCGFKSVEDAYYVSDLFIDDKKAYHEFVKQELNF